MQDSKFVGLCVLISSLVLSASIVYHARASAPITPTITPDTVGRYQFHPSNPPGVVWVIDTTTGEVKSKAG